jgi:hypothetical protein
MGEQFRMPARNEKCQPNFGRKQLCVLSTNDIQIVSDSISAAATNIYN